MRKILLIVFSFYTASTFGQSTYEKAWKALNENKWDEATGLLKVAMQNASSYSDAYITNLYLQDYKGKENEIRDFASHFCSKETNPYPYIYALWFSQAVAGSYGKKESDYQLNLINQLMNDSKAPGTLTAAANYQMGMHYLFSNNADKAKRYYNEVGNIRNWQYTGPFENLSQSGYYKNFGPVEHPEPDAVFKSLTNAEIKWFTPATEINDGWTPMIYQFNNRTAIVYAQNFIISAVDQTVYCNAGASGSIKVWINDELVIAEPKERVTEMDTYITRCDLKKGVNRVLVQLGFTRSGFPNFTIRFTDDKFRGLPNVTGSPVYAPYPAVKTSSRKISMITPFAEEYFTSKITANPENLLNYMLLANVYMRNKKVIEARNIITDAMDKAPDNCLLKIKMAEVLIKEENRTLLLEEVEKIKKLDPQSLLAMDLSIKENFNNQKYDDAAKELEKRISLYGEDETTADSKLLLLAQEKKYEELVKEVVKQFAKYPNNEKLLSMMYSVKSEVYKDKKGAMKLYDNYLKNNYNYNVVMKYIDLLSEQGDNNKALDLNKKLSEDFPYSPDEFYNLSKYYYGTKKYDKSEDNIRTALALSPYNETYWEQLGDIKNEKEEVAVAMDAYNRSLKYDPNQYNLINKIRKLNGKSELYRFFADTDIYEMVKNDKISDAKNADYGYYYILDNKNVILYPGGATEEYYTTLIRITNEKGVNKYKESYIGYGNSQSLLIEKAEVIKKNQSKINGEKNDNEIVFTNLEAGDVIVFKYRLRNYVYGRLAKEYWDSYYFGGQIYSAVISYHLLIPSDQKISYLFNNGNLQPQISEVENFKMYSWELLKPEPDKDESLMPPLTDVSAMLHVSTIPSWKEIADWYGDISSNKAEEDFEIIALYKKIFPDNQKPMTQFQKARMIYDYIESNIRYSSVSFRQSAYVPQRPSVTLTTRLGDCKDLSSLFVTLANMAGINAQMVLVDTRDNGQKHIILPGVEFNHCIVKTELDKKNYFIELTDNYLPFASLPNNLNGAVILEIPYKNKNNETPDLKLLKADNRTKDVIKRVIEIRSADPDLEISVKAIKYGNPSSSVRDNYVNLDNDKQKKDIEKSVASGYKNNVKMLDVKFNDLDKLNDSVTYIYNYRVKNEISEIGAIKTFRIVYPDVLASLDKFSGDTRTYPVLYWSYEDVDNYETVVNITAPAGSKFIEVPASENYSFKDMKFSLQYTLKAPDKLTITRKFSSNRQDIPAADYETFKTFFEKIVKAEQKFVAYK